MLTLRLSALEERELNSYCQRNNVSKSQVVKEALAMYFATKNKGNSYDLGSDLFGRAGSDDHDRSTSYKKRIKEKLRDKYPH